MKILFFGNNKLALETVKWLRDNKETISALVIHPEEKQKFAAEIIDAAGVGNDRIFLADELRDEVILEKIRRLDIDIGVSVLYGYILKKAQINLCKDGIVNLHTSYLPFNRGAFPNVWSIVERTPAGASLHYIDDQVDTGPIIAQIKVDVEPIDTGKTLYEKLEKAAFQLFTQTWPIVREKKSIAIKQSGNGSIHRVKDVEAIDKIDLDRKYTARELIDILRARTFPPFRGAYIEENGKKIYLELSLRYDD